MLTFEFGEATAGARAAADLPRVQLHGHAGVRLPRARPPLRLPVADGRLRSMGQHRERRRARPPGRRARAVRPDHAADHHRVRRQDGQDGAGRRLAERGPALGLRLLSVLAQRRRRRRRSLPAAVHRSAARRDRAPRRPSRAPSSTRPRRSWPTRRRGYAGARRQPRLPPRRRADCSSGTSAPTSMR